MSSKKDPPPFRLNLANAAAQKVDPQDPRLSRLIADAEDPPVAAPAPAPVPAAPVAAAPVAAATPPAVAAAPPVSAPIALAPVASAPEPVAKPARGRSAPASGQGLTVEVSAPTTAPARRPRRGPAPTVRITIAVDGPLPWETLGDMADVQRNMNLRLTETDLQKLQWLAQCLPGTSIQKLCRDSIREYVDARIADLLGR